METKPKSVVPKSTGRRPYLSDSGTQRNGATALKAMHTVVW